QSSHCLNRNINCIDHFLQLIQRTGHPFTSSGDPAAFIIANMVDHIVTAQVFQPCCSRYHVLRAQIIPHDLDAKVAPCLNHTFYGFFMSASHHHHVGSTCLGHHFGF